jgi:6-phosphogluconolactonase
MPTQKREVFVFDDPDEAAGYAAARWVRAATAALAQKARFDVAVSGGRTPGRLFNFMAAAPCSGVWDNTHLFQVDERYVPPDSPLSNSGLIRRGLLQGITIPGANVHFIPYADTAAVSAWRYEEDLKQHFQLTEGAFPRFDLIFLGIGEDGHTASLFPSDEALGYRNLLAVPVAARGERCARVTLTLPVLNHARCVVFLAVGKAKASVVKKILEESGRPLPAALVRPETGERVFVLDRAAGAELERSAPLK